MRFLEGSGHRMEDILITPDVPNATEAALILRDGRGVRDLEMIHVIAIEKALKRRANITIPVEHPITRRKKLRMLLQKIDHVPKNEDLSATVASLKKQRNLKERDEVVVLNYLRSAGISKEVRDRGTAISVNKLLGNRWDMVTIKQQSDEFAENSNSVRSFEVDGPRVVRMVLNKMRQSNTGFVNMNVSPSSLSDILNTILGHANSSRDLKKLIMFVGIGDSAGHTNVEWIMNSRNIALLIKFYRYMLTKTDDRETTFHTESSISRATEGGIINIWGEITSQDSDPQTLILDLLQMYDGQGFMPGVLSTDEEKKSINIILRWQLRQNTSREVGFFPYTLKDEAFPYSLERLQIFKKHELNENSYKENCVIHALRDQKVPEEKLSFLKNLRLDVGKRYIRTNDVNWIADILNIQINVKYVQNDERNRKTVFKPKSGDPDQVVWVGVIDKHMFSDYRMEDMTKFAFMNMGEIEKHYGSLPKNWGLLTRRSKTRKGGVTYTSVNPEGMTTYKMIKLMSLNPEAYLEPIAWSDEFLRTTALNELDKDLETKCPTQDVVEKNARLAVCTIPIEKFNGVCKLEHQGVKQNFTYTEYEEFGTKNRIQGKFFDYRTLTWITVEPGMSEFNRFQRMVYTEVKNCGKNKKKQVKKTGVLKEIVVAGKKYTIKVDNYIEIPKVKIVAFDTETAPNDERKHKAYIYRVTDDNSSNMFQSPKECLEHMTYYPPNTLFIAHNLAFDFCQLAKEPGVKILNGGLWKSASKVMIQDIEYNGIPIKFADSLSLIPEPLSKFGEMFNLEQGKAVMPYTLYTESNIKERFIALGRIRKHLKTSDDWLKFQINCKKWGVINGKQEVDIIAYSDHYCKIDTEVLLNGYNIFRGWMLDFFDIDIINCVSAPNIAYKVLESKGVFDGVYKFSGQTQKFMSQAIRGGRVMSAKNERVKIINECIDDFDAVSLYPSAMVRMKSICPGIPTVIDGEEGFEQVKRDGKYFIIKAKIIKIGKKRIFPVLSKRMVEGQNLMPNGLKKTPNVSWSNNLEGESVHIDQITYEDAVKYQDIEFRFIEGLAFKQPENDNMKKCMEDIFKLRLKLKAEKNPAQALMKLIMNSAYGRLIMSPIDSNTVFVEAGEKGDGITRFIDKNENQIIDGCITYLNDERTKARFEVRTPISEHYSIPHGGISVLSHSKRIMNEVMCLAEDKGVEIYYQDTDSMHLKSSGLEILQSSFKEKYGRELVGNGLGQFHCDFTVDVPGAENIHSVGFIALGKKCYIDDLRFTHKNKEGECVEGQSYHIRFKGVPSDAMLKTAELEGFGSLFDMYEKLHDTDDSIEIDLVKASEKPFFQVTKGLDYLLRNDFVRTIRANGHHAGTSPTH